MPASLQSFSSAEIAIKWQEPYVSQGLNRGVSAHGDRGVQRGFRLTPSGSALTVTIAADAVSSDHSAMYRTATGYGVSLQKSGGNFNLNLSAYASKTAVIALYATYSTGVPTTASIRAYELAPSNEYKFAAERDELIVLGVVKVPASGTIAAQDITHEFRIEAWQGRNEQAVTPRQLIRNGNFEQAAIGEFATFQAWSWYRIGEDSNLAWYVTDTDPPVTADSKHLSSQYLDGFGTIESSMCQVLNLPVVTGDVLRFRMKVWVVTAPTTGALKVKLHYLDEDGVTVTASEITIPTGVVDAAYRQIDYRFTVPANVRVVSYLELQLDSLGLGAGITAEMVRAGDVELWSETRTALKVGKQHETAQAYTPLLALIPNQAAGLGVDYAAKIAQSLALYVHQSSTTQAIIRGERKDLNAAALQPLLDWLGPMRIGGSTDNKAAKLSARYGSGSATPVSLSMELGPNSTATRGRIYAGTNGEMFLTVNCSATSSGTLTWTKDTAGVPAWKWVIGTIDSVSFPKLQYRAPGADADWADTAWQTFWTSGERLPATVKTANFAIDESAGFWPVDTTAGVVTATLPSPATCKARTFVIKDVSTTGAFSVNPLTIAQNAAEMIEGLAASYIFAASGTVRVYSDGTDWWFV